MNLSVAIVLFMIKMGIKQIDGNYDLSTFLEDTVEAFGKDSGEKIIELLKISKSSIEQQLSVANLTKLGIPEKRAIIASANAKDIFKYVKISSRMLIDNNCDDTKITQDLCKTYAQKLHIYNNTPEMNDLYLALNLVVKQMIIVSQSKGDFLYDILFDIRERQVYHGKIIQQHSVYLKKIDEKTDDGKDKIDEMYDMLKSLTQNKPDTYISPPISEHTTPLDASFLASVYGKGE